MPKALKPHLNDLFSIYSKGLLSEKYEKKFKEMKTYKINYFQNKQIKDAEKHSARFILPNNDLDIHQQLKYSENNYFDYQNLIKPAEYNLSHLCPKKNLNSFSPSTIPVASLIQRENYNFYRKESLKFLKKTNGRIAKAKEYLKIARLMNKKY